MKTIYTIYLKEHAPEVLVQKFPKASEYDPDFYLFGLNAFAVTGVEAELRVDLSGAGYVEGEESVEFDGDAFVALLDATLASNPTAEVKINKQQAYELYSRKPQLEEEL